MRRSRNSDRGIGMSRQNLSPGPLITDHIRNLDLELELLKRKREMLEQQHTLFQPFQKQTQQRNYNQQAYTYNENIGQGSSNRDFSQLYDDGPQQNRKPFPKKRPADNNWQYDSYPKKSAGYGRGYAGPSPIQNQNSFARANQSKIAYPNKPVQGKPSIGQRITNQKPQIPAKNFVPKTITKPTKALAPPNKISSQPIPERNQLVAATMKSVAETEIRKREENVLLPDQEPTRQMRGRMEMSLGAILSNVREAYADSPHAVTLGTNPLQRIIKQAIRDRIRTVLLGKVVGPTKDIIKEYRDMFPKETDRDIVNEAMKAVGLDTKEQSVDSVVNKKLELLVKPEDVFKENVTKLLNSHLLEMFNKIEEIYTEPEKENEDSQENLNGDSVQIKTETTVSGEQSNVVNDEEVPNTNTDNTKTDDNMLKVEESVKIEVDGVKNNEDITMKDDDSVKKNEKTLKEEYDAIKAAGDAAAAELRLVDQTMYKQLLPKIIKRHVMAIVKTINVSRMYKEIVGDLIAAARAKYLESKQKSNNENVQQSGSTEITSAANSTPKKALYPLPYYVKIMGKPQLPKKNVMQPFLEEFHPKSVKKHRTIHNLLFVGFTEKNDFDAIVKANGTVIGRSTLSIRICENSNENKESKPSENVETNLNSSTEAPNQNSEEINTSNEDTLGGDLNKQIDDLLNAVGQEEENSSSNLNDSNLEKPEKEDLIDDVNQLSNEETNAASNKEANENENLTCPEIDEGAISNETAPENEKPQSIEPQETDSDPSNPNTANKEDIELKEEKTDKVSELTASVVRSTPTRASTRLANTPATPSSIKTRRASKLAQN